MHEKIEIDYQGRAYKGDYHVEGINQRLLTVWYRGKKRTDDFDSRAEEPGFVECLTERLLLEMVTEDEAESGLDRAR